MKANRRPHIPILAGLLTLMTGCSGAQVKHADSLSHIDHIVVIYLENRSFDNLFGLFPGADGLEQAAARGLPQTDTSGQVYKTLPIVMDTSKKPAAPDARFPKDLPNQPVDIGRYVPPEQKTGDLAHRFYLHQQQINGGRMDRFAALSDAGGLTMGYYDMRNSELWKYASRYTLADHFFQAAFGGSFHNHIWLVCACAPRFENAPDKVRSQIGPDGSVTKELAVTPDGYTVNTLQPSAAPRAPDAPPAEFRLPPQTLPTIGDRLSDKGISWRWYSGGWNDAVAGKPDKTFQFHHQPFVYFARYGENSPDRREHLKDRADLLADLAANRLPAVAFYKPLGKDNQHSGYSDVVAGDRETGEILRAIEASAAWPKTLVIVTYDEFGGYWDHVAPPKVDRFGPGSRVPAIIVSPFAKNGYVDHASYDTTSILKLIETRFGLDPLTERDAKAGDLRNALR